MSHDSVRVDDLLTREVSVQWYEGVAVVQGVCRQLLDKGTSGGRFPEPADIALGRDGSVSILGTSPTQAGAAAAHLLAGMLGDEPPVRLRLAVTQGTGEQTQGDLREFSETLAYFARPDAEGIIRALVDRVMLAPHRTAANEERAGDFHAAPAPAPAASQGRHATGASRRTLVAAAVGLFIVAGVLAVAALRSGPVAAAITGAQQALASPAPAPAEADSPKPEVTKQGAGSIATAERSQRSRTSSPVAGGRTQHPPRGEASTSLSVSLSPRMPVAASLATSPALGHVDQSYEIVAKSPVNEDGLDPIYSKSDSEVMPPSQVYPALPADVPAVTSGSLTVVELVIGTDGLVERVRFRTPPKDVLEFMLLSAAKAWRFNPATSGGRPVRFLHTVAITRS